MGEAEIPSLCHDSLKVPIVLLVLCSAMCRAFLMSALVVTTIMKSTVILFTTYRCKGASIMFSNDGLGLQSSSVVGYSGSSGSFRRQLAHLLTPPFLPSIRSPTG
jgi:hypothetical protein